MPLRGTSLPTIRIRNGPSGSTGLAAGVNSSGSTPQGTTATCRRAIPIGSSSRTSSVQVAITRSAVRAISRSAPIRSAGLVSALPCQRRFTLPSA
jgi:hypothetical protein